MPYFYHLVFELYPTPDPAEAVDHQTDRADPWLPHRSTGIFDDLPGIETPSGNPRGNEPVTHAAPSPESATDRSTPRTLATVSSGSPAKAASQRQRLERTTGRRPPVESSAPRLVRDWRFGRVTIETIDPATPRGAGAMQGQSSRAAPSAAPSLGPSFGGAGTATKADFVPLKTKVTEAGWGVVRFYRDGEESAALGLGGDGAGEELEVAETVDDCTTLCIPAVPAYMSPSDFLGFVGDGWRDEVSHCRMVMTSRMNRYLVLLKFREGKVAKKWKREFDGKVFNSMEPQLCHVVFVKSITFETPLRLGRLDPAAAAPSSSLAVASSTRPFPPPTPNLIELPTCPVCLERMDDTNGLMTIPCSHVFHCTCLQNWKGAGCPVCRFTNTPGLEGTPDDARNPCSQPFGSSVSNLCSVCDCTDDLWICLVCGNVGCGRYKGGHAKDHWKETAHSFALELETQYVWDYAGDVWVHRLIRDKGDGKVVELPGRSNHSARARDEDVVPRAKVDNIGLEYTHLITSQLESQRVFYEDMLSKAVDKAARASAAAESAAAQSAAAADKLKQMEDKFAALTTDTLPQLERDFERERGRAARSEAMARNMSKSLQEERRINEGLMKRIEHLGGENEALRKEFQELKRENDELGDMNRDLGMFISGQEKLKQLESEGKIEQGELEGGSASVAEKKPRRRGKR
ncbi:uncharacterized protein UV8b_07169 [Ustilaginoidea virens]|uniref:RING-10 protein n=1 Tax=Ustilaginoidea virens TaxID=1159556 RepID=A0A8E5HX35_USTVR|nr:uncharacterized protein UV8b_07169 [Ustilaginoidea virens]QUC22928.1 hypothetical protein UV8b_07169 [Ustilaginoidea virens]